MHSGALRPAPALIEAGNLLHTYGRGDAAVRALDISHLTVRGGEVVLLEGPSGSGKTTLISVLGTLLHPQQGWVAIRGQEVDWRDRLNLEHLRSREIGFVFQSFNLLEPLNARENVEVALNATGVRGRAAREQAIDMLTRVDMSHRAQAKVSVLSGGERQRVAIARALATNPAIILADEPTGNLDTDHGAEVGETLGRLAAEGRAVIVTTHDPRLEPYATRRLHMVDGRLVSELAMEQAPRGGASVKWNGAPVPA